LLGYLFVGVLAVTALVAALLAVALSSLGILLPAPMTPEEIERLPWVRESSAEELRGPLTWLTAVWVALAAVLVVLVRVWVRRRARPGRRPTTEERSFRLPPRARQPAAVAVQPATAPRRRGAPTDAVGAYLAALDDIAEHDRANARVEHETPRAHAARIGAGPELIGLQADYALARYGSRALSPAEDRRAIARWLRIRERVRRLH
jgi:hypothetical protein